MSVTSRLGAVLALLTCLALQMSPASEVLGQEAHSDPVQEYSLRFVRAADVAPQLRNLIGEDGRVFVDAERNRVAVSGSQRIQQVASQLIRRLDQAAPPQPRDAANLPEVRAYRVPSDELEGIAADLKRRFPGARIATDVRLSQLVIVGPPQVHAEIDTLLEPVMGPARPEAPAGPSQDMPRRSQPQGNRSATGTVHDLQSITWRELEDALRRMVGDRAQVIGDENSQLATVTVPGRNGPQTVMEIDRENNRVIFSGDDNAANAWRQVAAALDVPRATRDASTQIVPVSRARPSSVERAVSLMRAVSEQEAANDTAAVQVGAKRGAGGDLVSMIFRKQQDDEGEGEQAPEDQQPPEPEDGQVPEDQAGGEQAGEGDQDLLGAGLFGPVTIEYLEGLNMFIIKGNPRDVQRVLRVIEEIEKQAAENQPEIEIYPLENADGKALTELIRSFYDQVYAVRQSPVSIIALGRPNSLLLIGLKESIAEVKKLIAKLDTPVDPETQVRIFNLKHASSTDLERVILNVYQTEATRRGAATTQPAPGFPAPGVAAPGVAAGPTQSTADLLPRVVVVADFRSNALIVQAAPRDMSEIANLIERLDVDDSAATVQVRVFPLKNTTAVDLQQVLETTIRGNRGQLQAGQQFGAQGFQPQIGGAGANQQGTTPSEKLSIQALDENGRVISSGLMTNVIITADAVANTLVVRAPEKSMELIAELIRQLDELPAGESQIKVFELRNGDASSVTQLLQQLFGLPVTAGQGALSQLTQAVSLANLRTGAGAGEGSLIPLQFSFDPRTNSVIATGAAADLRVVETLILRLDEGGIQTRVTEVIRLKNAPAGDVATAIFNFLDQQRQISNLQFVTGGIGTFNQQIDREIVVVPELITNSLIVSATPRYYESVRKIISDLDYRPAMVEIQVVIAEIQLDDAFEFGVEAGLQDSLMFNRGITGGSAAPGFNFNTTGPLPNANLFNREQLAGQGLANFNVGRQSANLGYGGLVLSASNESVNVLLRALQDEGRVQILSRPKITTLDTEAAFVQVGQTTSRITGSTANTVGGVQNSVVDTQIGLLLRVTPRVNQDGMIAMTVDTENSALDVSGVPVAVDPTGNPVISPNINITTASSTLMARSGQTVVFAGLIQTQRSKNARKIPYLSDVPIVGRLFRFDSEAERRSELMVIMTPYLIDSDEDLEWLNWVESDRMSWCLSDVVALDGDHGLSAGRGLWGQGKTNTVYPHVNPTGFESGAPIGPPEGLMYESTLERQGATVISEEPTPAGPTEVLDAPPVMPSEVEGARRVNGRPGSAEFQEFSPLPGNAPASYSQGTEEVAGRRGRPARLPRPRS